MRRFVVLVERSINHRYAIGRDIALLRQPAQLVQDFQSRGYFTRGCVAVPKPRQPFSASSRKNYCLLHLVDGLFVPPFLHISLREFVPQRRMRIVISSGGGPPIRCRISAFYVELRAG